MNVPLVLDGRVAAATVETRLGAAVRRLVGEGYRPPHLAAIRVGSLGPSVTYVEAKLKACHRVGYTSTQVELPDSVEEEKLLEAVRHLNADAGLDGFIVQLPLPAHIDTQAVIETILPEKDVDGFHPINLGRLAQGLPCFAPATPAGVLELLRQYGIPTEGRHAVVVGRSNIVGTPLALLLSRARQPGNCTVTLCHSRSVDLAEYTRQADLLFLAVGQQGMIGAEHVRQGAVVVDVGIHRIADPRKKAGYRLVGDVRVEEVLPYVSAYTPVPGGVGPMTIALLLENTLRAFVRRHNLPETDYGL